MDYTNCPQCKEICPIFQMSYNHIQLVSDHKALNGSVNLKIKLKINNYKLI